MKRKLALLLILALMGNALFSCGEELVMGETTMENEKTETVQESDTAIGVEETATEPEAAPPTETSILDGKKVLFLGNSYTYYGKTVLVKTPDVRTQAERSNDHGYFYQLCKSRGAEVSVTNWTFGNHSLRDLFGVCAAGRGCDGVKHLDDLKDRWFDYVMMNPGPVANLPTEENLATLDRVLAVFREVNPDVKFYFLTQRRVYEKTTPWVKSMDKIRERGVTVVEWGKLVNDVIFGKTKVPGAQEKYNQNTFIVRKSESDGYHPNMLTGYITTLMTYCAITGESAVGQSWAFCGDKTLNPAFDFDAFIGEHYTYGGATTNFPAIFASESDMKGLQELMDRYLS